MPHSTAIISFLLLSLSSCSSIKQWRSYNRNDLAKLSYRDILPNKLQVVEVDPTKLQPLLLASQRVNQGSQRPFHIYTDQGPSARDESAGAPSIQLPEEQIDISILEEALPELDLAPPAVE